MRKNFTKIEKENAKKFLNFFLPVILKINSSQMIGKQIKNCRFFKTDIIFSKIFFGSISAHKLKELGKL